MRVAPLKGEAFRRTFERGNARYRASSLPRSAFAARLGPAFRLRRKVRRTLAAVLAFALAAAVLGMARHALLPNAFGEGQGAAGAAGGGSASTPTSEWRIGQVPYLYQTDPAWSGLPYAGATVGESGCGPTCLAMVYICLTGSTDRDPVSLCALAERGGYVEQGMTSWLFMTEGARELGISSRELPASASAVKDALTAGQPVICSMAPGDFTTTGHFIVLAGVDDQGRVIVRDPNSAERSSRLWDMGAILSQCRNLWAFSR